MRPRRKPRNFFRFITSDNSSSLNIPTKFTREHRKQILLNDVLLIVSDDKVWPLGWMVSGDGKLWLQKGWPEFHDHYCLKFGHILYFTHMGKSIFHVRIFDPSYQEIYNFPPKKYLKSFPSYSVTIRASYLRGSIVYAPVGFCRRYLVGDRKVGSCVLRMSNGGRWGPVNCRVFETYARLCGKSWRKFSDENRLCVGDVCVFELINDVEKVMNVTISRAC
ncbi:hypothetical protein L1987_18052 [Smallanthus sonchifolius]|uniref:Uncharacterized protein n=1 Tax=Smallanthus sonchifolius TaxID=185202 RepID=A0ACB9IZR2_9ASTR|nr:hypothetical protein L1987_18052 [Smallanthus sonchifolius]